MFDSPSDAADALRDYFDPPRIEILIDALIPSIGFVITDGPAIIGGSKIGGVPDLPQGMSWPRPPVPADPEENAGRANDETEKELLEHFSRKLPYTFIAQVNLEDAAVFEIAEDLPQDGRLLFFYDLVGGPWDISQRVARVIWDQSPVTMLEEAQMPSDLKRADDAFRRDQKEYAPFGADPDSTHPGGTSYGAAERAVGLRQEWRLPDMFSIEYAEIPEAEQASGSVSNDDTTDAQMEFVADYEEFLYEYQDYSAGQRQQLLGSPDPEQDDPRYDAVVWTEFGVQHLSREDWQTHRSSIMSKARDWRLLLQVDLADWMQSEFSTGTVFFLIRNDDLKTRNFDDVIAVYQQT